MKNLMEQPDFQKQLAQVNKAKEAGLVSRGKGKAASKSKEPKEKKSRTEKTKSEKSDKKQKKPDNYPKAAQTAFFLFAGDKRGPLMAELKDIKLVAKQMGVLWGEVSVEEKAKYEKLAEADKERYAKECAEKGISVKATTTAKAPKGKAQKRSASSSSSSSGSSSDSSSDSSNSSSSSSSSDSD
eukprot:GDKJ01054153.1.p1 GENE.GDKJ01054153.1~~GDKJ01054153.1.p1  ORF type:complete len:199 (+),score=60.48 GDKJ01054153.1:46-597(+)